jgi:uncharacterized protein YkwD
MSLSSLNGNWVDLLVIIVFIYFIGQAFRLGFWSILIDFITFLVSLFIALTGFGYIANLLRQNFSLSHSFSNALGFLFTAVIIEGILGIVFSYLFSFVPKKYQKLKYGKIASLPFAAGEAIILIAFATTLVIGLPVSPNVKAAVAESRFGGIIVKKTSGFEARIDEIFGGVIEDSITYLTVKPDSQEAIQISIDAQELKVDENAENKMFNLVNEERQKRGLDHLKWDPELVNVARVYAKDMWERKYFGHYSPEGESVGDRLEKKNIKYNFAGENLALAPTVSTAHTGLMNSQGHRENILEKDFSTVGIGVIDAGIYGKMFVQVFTD